MIGSKGHNGFVVALLEPHKLSEKKTPDILFS